MARNSVISHSQYLGLRKDTQAVEAVEQLVKSYGVRKAREYVQANFAALLKDATTTGVTTGLGLNFIDLRRPVYMLNPVYTPLRNRIPRWDKTNAGYGLQPQWKALTSIGAGQVPFISEGNTNSYATYTEKDYAAPYISLGTDDFVTYEATSASEGFEDVLGEAKKNQILRFLIQQEQTYIGGAGNRGGIGGLQLTTTPTPVGVLSALNNAIYLTGALPVGAYAAAYAVALNYRAATNPLNNVTNGVTTQYLRSNADGSTDVINGGTAAISLVSNVVGPTVSGTKTVQFSCTPQAGAWGYAWFVQVNTTMSFTPAKASAFLAGVTTLSTFNYYGQAVGTQSAAYAGSGGYAGFATDLSVNALDMDGLLTIASNSAYTTGLPSWSYPANTATQTALAGGVDLHGASLTNGGLPGTIAEFDAMLYAIQQSALTSPTAIYVATNVVGAFRSAFLVGATGSAQANFFFPNGGRDEDSLSITTRIADYDNVFALDGDRGRIPVIQHPYLPPGTVFFDVDRMGEAYSNSELMAPRGVFVRRDTYGIEFAQTSRKYPFGVFSEEVLAVKTPNLIGYIKGIGATFGQTNLF